MSRKQSAEYCNMSVRQFDRERRAEPQLLEPCGFAGQIPQWRPEGLDHYLARHRRRGCPTDPERKSGRSMDAE